MLVSEVFDSVQGEGPNLGRPSTFLRLGGCNLGCVWCDAAYTWRFSDRHKHIDPTIYDPKDQLTKMGVNEVYKKITDFDINHYVITGGEPLLQRMELESLVALLLNNRYVTIEFETAGTLRPLQTHDPRISYIVSPKLENSGNDFEDRYKIPVLKEFANRDDANFKFVISNEEDLKETDRMVWDFHIKPERVWIMPEGTTIGAISEKSAKFVRDIITRRYNLTTRLQIIAYGNKRGT